MSRNVIISIIILFIILLIYPISSKSSKWFYQDQDGDEDFESALTSLKQKRSLLDLDKDQDPSSSPAALLHKCQTIETTMEIQKEEHSSTSSSNNDGGSSGELLRRCQGTMTINKCEGGCVSNLRPSINTISGLIKECNCCRETVMQEKQVVLDNCFDVDGNLMDGETMTITVNEPHQCSCYKCSN